MLKHIYKIIAITKNQMAYINLYKLTATLGNEHFGVDYLNCDNVSHYINFKDGGKYNSNPNNFILINRISV